MQVLLPPTTMQERQLGLSLQKDCHIFIKYFYIHSLVSIASEMVPHNFAEDGNYIIVYPWVSN